MDSTQNLTSLESFNLIAIVLESDVEQKPINLLSSSENILFFRSTMFKKKGEKYKVEGYIPKE